MQFEQHVIESLKSITKDQKEMLVNTATTKGKIESIEKRLDKIDKVIWSFAGMLVIFAWFFIQKHF